MLASVVQLQLAAASSLAAVDVAAYSLVVVDTYWCLVALAFAAETFVDYTFDLVDYNSLLVPLVVAVAAAAVGATEMVPVMEFGVDSVAYL